MNGGARWWVVLVVAALMVGCEGEGEQEQPEEADEHQAQEEDEVEGVEERRSLEGPADELAARVGEAHGAEAFEALSQLNFDFVVISEGEEAMRARHRWDLEADEDRVRWMEEDTQVEVVLHVESEEAREVLVDGDPVEDEERRRELGEAAYQRWVNDTYWLLMPIKLFDPGVHREHLGSFEGDEELEVLELSFEEVGLTPGDRYELRINEAGEVVSWLMDLEGSDEPREVAWDDYQDIGPLRLSLERRMEGMDRQIRLENVEIK